MKFLSVFLVSLTLVLSAKEIETFYGPLEVEEPVILELIESPAFQRLKEVKQYGVAYYTSHKEEYNRYDHSIGVFALLHARGAPVEEQVAGLLHDVSHTAFSHVGDWVFGQTNQAKSYQDLVFTSFIKKCEIAKILEKYDLSPEQIINDRFPALKCPLPEVCADRLDYNIQGAYHQGFITHDEAIKIFKDLKYTEGRWVSEEVELMEKLARFALHMTETCWGGPFNHVTSQWLADAILRCIAIGDLTIEKFHCGTDEAIWELLSAHEDKEIQMYLHRILNAEKCYTVVDDESCADVVVHSKFRGIDPWVRQDGVVRHLSECNGTIGEEFRQKKALISRGWPIKISER